MPVRLDRITTRTGDDGTTGLADGVRLPKDHPLIAAIGAVDEANSHMGMVRLLAVPDSIAVELPRVQNELFDLGADLASPPGGPHEATIPRLQPGQVLRLEGVLEQANRLLPPLRSFVLPGGPPTTVWLHLTRTCVRRCERDVVAAIHACPERLFNPEIVRYLNRLSDLCFVWARQCALMDGAGEMLWVPSQTR